MWCECSTYFSKKHKNPRLLIHKTRKKPEKLEKIRENPQKTARKNVKMAAVGTPFGPNLPPCILSVPNGLLRNSTNHPLTVPP